jgi:hypothetical protein
MKPSSEMVKLQVYRMPPRLLRELKTVWLMIELYCSDLHESEILCEACTNLYNYAEKRLEQCRYQENKPSCSSCDVHCYRKSKASEIKKVMRYSGPKMIFKHPVLAIKHIVDERRKL